MWSEREAAKLHLHDLMAMRPTRMRSPSSVGRRQPGGDRHGRGRAPGFEFEGIERYQRGDDIRRIDWIATARTGRVQMRRTLAEAHRAAMLVVDLAPEMRFGTRVRPMAKTAALAAARLIWEAQLRGEPVGLCVPGGRIAEPGRGRRHALRLLGALVEEYEAAPAQDSIEALAVAAERLGRGDDLVFVGNPLGDPAAFSRATQHLAERLSLCLLLVEDPIVDEPVGPGAYPARAGQEGRREVLRITGSPTALERAAAARRTGLDLLQDAGWTVQPARDLLPSEHALERAAGASG